MGLASILGIRGVLPEVMTSEQQTEDIKARKLGGGVAQLKALQG